jgi:alkylhydroperoxidase family enzyme
VQAVLQDWRSAPIDAKLRAQLAFLEKLTLLPDEVQPRDVEPLRVAGLSDRAIEDAINVCALFSIYDRMADSLGWYLPDAGGYAASAQNLMRRGYLL